MKEMKGIAPVTKDLLYVKIADSIYEYIKSNNMQEGDKLPSERNLAEMLQTGRHSVREALRVLENDGIIKVQSGSGTYVAHKAEENTTYLKFVKINYMELLNIKTELEKYAVRLGIAHATKEQLEDLERLLEPVEENMRAGFFDTDVDKKFHAMLSKLSGNSMLHQMIQEMIVTFDAYYSYIPQTTTLCLDTIPYHRALVEAMKQRNMQEAMEACDTIHDIDLKLIAENQK